MRKTIGTLACGGALLFAMSIATAQPGTVKIGVILPYSGQFADPAAQMDNAIKLYMKQHGDTVAGRKIEIIRKDSSGMAPDVAKRLAQELVTRDKVDIFGGMLLTPTTLAVADVSASAKVFTVIMNAATSNLTTKSPYIVRTSVTTPMLNEILGAWAAKRGARKVYTMVSDFSPGHDAEAAFQLGLKEAGGEIVGSVRFPVANPDFSAFIQRAKDSNPDSIYIWIPGGAQPAAIGKALAERNIDPNKIMILGQDVLADESALKSMGDIATGIVTAAHYDYNHESPKNWEFVREYREAFNRRRPDIFSIGGYDGMHLIYEALKKTGGRTDGESLVAAAKGMKWESPRGPVEIDPETRDIILTVYIQKVTKTEDGMRNVEIDKFENVKDPVKARMK